MLSLQRQHLLSNEEIKQPSRPRIVIDKMADINETSDDAAKPEGYLQRKKSDVCQNSENDDDDDVVMDNKKSPRHEANGTSPETLVNGSPSTPRKHDDIGTPASRPESAAVEKQDVSSRSISANSDRASRNSVDNPATAFQSRPSSAVSSHKDEEKEEKLPSRPPSSKEVDIMEESMEDSAKSETGLTSPPLEDSKSDKTSRPPSTTSIGPVEEAKQPPGSPYPNDALGNAEHTLKTPSRSSDNSRSSTPSRLETPQNAEREAKSPSKTPDKSRSSTPAVLEATGNAEQESRTPTKTPDKSRSSTPAGLEPPCNEELKSRTPSKSPDKSRASTPANLAPSPQEKEPVTPAKTPEKSRSATPAGSGAEPDNDEAAAEAEGPDDHDKSGEDTLQVKQPSRPASSLGSPNLTAGRDSKSPKSPRSPRSPTTPESQSKLSVPGSPGDIVKGFDNGRQRSLSSRTTPSGSPRSPSSPKSSAGSVKQSEGEKKRTSFAEDPVTAQKAAETVEKTLSPTPTSPSKPAIPSAKTRRVATPVRLIDEKTEQKSSEKQGPRVRALNELNEAFIGR